jgi:hypothetical protein
MTSTGFLFDLFFDLEDGGDMFSRNVIWFTTDYMALYPRTKNFSGLENFRHVMHIWQTSDNDGIKQYKYLHAFNLF